MESGQPDRVEKPVYWIGSSKKDLKTFPEKAIHEIGVNLSLVQWGDTPDDAKPLKGFKGADVLEIVERYDTDTYRLVYTVRFQKAVYVLHAFQKKSKQGIKTPIKEIDVVKSRLRAAEEDYARRYADGK